ncbi:MAG TPA: hypothetical protein VFT66_00215 [Roseiflexaceae bacterium]|jgi:hypothetical protein|nr:hypothetical protein [Roseiflexaceae bacterium]
MRDILKFFENMSPETYLSAVVGSIFLSLGLRAAGKKDAANFVGLWAPTICNLGLYLKLLQPSKKGIFK